MNQDEAASAIRVIGAVAQADGTITDEERLAFRQALTDFAPNMPDGTTVDSILDKPIDVDEALAGVKSPVMRKAVFEAAFAMSIVDGRATPEENDVIKKIRASFDFATEASVLDQALIDNRRATDAAPVLSADERRERIDALCNRRALLAAVFGAIPLPLVGDFGVLLQIDAVIEGVAVTWGHPLIRKERFVRFGAVLSIAIAQSAVHSLIKLIPGYGSVAGAFGGALTAYMATFAIGRVVNYHFEKEGKTTAAELRSVFAKSKEDAKKAYEKDKDKIDAAKNAHAAEIAALTKQLEKKEITAEELDAKVGEIVGVEKK